MNAISRRGLLGLLRGGASPPKEKPFSLGDFYGTRGAPSEIPHFRVVCRPDVPVSSFGRNEERTRAATEPSARADFPAPAVPRASLLVRIRPSTCLAFGSFCSVCQERCPVPGAIVVEAGRPRIVETACDGCGICVEHCPAPINGLEIVPRS